MGANPALVLGSILLEQIPYGGDPAERAGQALRLWGERGPGEVDESMVQDLVAMVREVRGEVSPALLPLRSGLWIGRMVLEACDRAGLEAAGLACHVSEDWHAQVDALILGIKSGASRAELSVQWRRLTSDLHSQGIDTAVLACTDLNVAAEGESDGLAVIDSARCLARAVVREYLQLQETNLAKVAHSPDVKAIAT